VAQSVHRPWRWRGSLPVPVALSRLRKPSTTCRGATAVGYFSRSLLACMTEARARAALLPPD
jgi:hypothetical protein